MWDKHKIPAVEVQLLIDTNRWKYEYEYEYE